MPFHLKRLSQAPLSAVALFTLIGIGMIVAAGVMTVGRIQRIHDQWHLFTGEAVADTQRLHRIHRHLGYGGLIHHFKNYVLRRDASRVPLIERELRTLRRALDDMARNSPSAEITQAVDELRATVEAYAANFELARRLVAKGRSAEEIDALVKVDDTPALAAIETLARHTLEHSRQGERATGDAIEASVQTISVGVLLMIPLVIGAGLVVVFTLGDVGRRLRAEEALRRAREESQEHREQLAHLSRVYTVGEMASGIGHEINQPLTAIGGYVRAAVRRLEHEPVEREKLRELLLKIDAQATRAAEVITRLRAMIRREPSRRQPTDLNRLIRRTAELAELECRQHGVRLRLELAEGLPQPAIDAVQIEQVTLNLIRNALDATTGSDHPEANEIVITSLLDDGQRVRVTVADRGLGVAAPLDDEIYHAFVTTKPNGLGVGLAICSTILESFGGSIRHAPRPGGGTHFHFTLPIGDERATGESPTPSTGDAPLTEKPHA